jgi:hypothetical protein
MVMIPEEVSGLGHAHRRRDRGRRVTGLVHVRYALAPFRHSV